MTATWEIREGNALSQLQDMPDAGIQCCITSPPYYGLRDYGAADQIGLEPTPGEYVARLVGVFRQVRRVPRHSGAASVKRGKPLQRRTPLKQRKPWLRSRKPQKRVQVQRDGPTMAMAAWRAEVMAASQGRSVVSGERADDAHHLITEQRLRKDGRLDLITHPMMGVALTRAEHAAHHAAMPRLALSSLPAGKVAWVREQGYGGSLDRYYRHG